MTSASTPDPADTTTATDILIDAFGRVHDELPGLLEGLETASLLWRPEADANPVGWLTWHLTRVQDDHLAGVGQIEQAWTARGFAERFALPYEPGAIGYGQGRDEVDAFTVQGPQDLLEYHEAVHELTIGVLQRLRGADYARIVDHDWDPPVTAAARLVSVVNDTTAHLGQIAYLRGLVDRGAHLGADEHARA